MAKRETLLLVDLLNILLGKTHLAGVREKTIQIAKENPDIRNEYVEQFENLLQEIKKEKDNFKTFGEFQKELFIRYLDKYGIEFLYKDYLFTMTNLRFLFQNFFLWLGKDITIDLFKAQQATRLTYSKEEKKDLLSLYIDILAEIIEYGNHKEDAERIRECRDKVVGYAINIDDGLWELRAVIYLIREKILQVYLFNQEIFNMKKPMVSIADMLTLNEEKLKEKIELAKLIGKEYSEKIDYGIGVSLNKGFLGYCEREMGSMAIPYLDLPFIIVPAS